MCGRSTVAPTVRRSCRRRPPRDRQPHRRFVALRVEHQPEVLPAHPYHLAADPGRFVADLLLLADVAQLLRAAPVERAIAPALAVGRQPEQHDATLLSGEEQLADVARRRQRIAVREMERQAVRHHVQEEPEETVKERRSAFATAASFNFLAEFGDKTQIAVIILAASYDAPGSVFLGGSAGLALIAVLSVVIGTGLSRVLSEKWLRLLSTVLFILAGALLIVEAFLEL